MKNLRFGRSPNSLGCPRSVGTGGVCCHPPPRGFSLELGIIPRSRDAPAPDMQKASRGGLRQALGAVCAYQWKPYSLPNAEAIARATSITAGSLWLQCNIVGKT